MLLCYLKIAQTIGRQALARR